MDAITLLKRQHAQVRELFTEFIKADGPQRRQAVFVQLADELAAHCEIEERLFYPAVFVDELQDVVKEAVEEHLAAKRLIADLLVMEPIDGQYAAKVAVLAEQVEHHIKEEHEELFPRARLWLSAAALRSLGELMEARYRALVDGGAPRARVPFQTGAATVPAPPGA